MQYDDLPEKVKTHFKIVNEPQKLEKLKEVYDTALQNFKNFSELAEYIALLNPEIVHRELCLITYLGEENDL